MNIERLKLMETMLHEIRLEQWKGNSPKVRTLTTLFSKRHPVNGFSLDYWIKERKGGCGYMACAVGHALVDPRFNALGLTAQHSKYDSRYYAPVYDDSRGFAAVAEFFDISAETCERLFAPSSYSKSCRNDPIWVEQRVGYLITEGQDNFLKTWARAHYE